MTQQSLSSWLNIKSDDIDCSGLAADFDGSLSGLGVELGSSTYNMSEALLALPVFKQENLDAGYFSGWHFDFDFPPVGGHQRWAPTNPQPMYYQNQTSPPNHGGIHGFDKHTHHGGHLYTTVHNCGADDPAITWAPPPRPPQSIPQRCSSSEDDGDNARHSVQDVSGESPSSDVSGFSLELLRGALVASSEHDNRDESAHHSVSYGLVQQGSPPGDSSYSVSQGLQALRFNTDKYRFQYILNAGTSPATKVNEETLTYLNQGQSYEIKLKKYGDASEHSTVKSIIRVVFHDRRLQYAELEQLQLWRLGRPGERLLDIDVPLSSGLFDVTRESYRLNSISFKWEPNKECIVFVKVHCISTEFTPKKHGGEKGVPFRVQIETYSDDDDSTLLHCASCQVKVFKPKGADRKQKTDRDKMEKRSGAEKEKYQPAYEVTVLSELPLDQAQSYLQQLAQQELSLQTEYNKKLNQQSSPTNTSKWSSTTSGAPSAANKSASTLSTDPAPSGERATSGATNGSHGLSSYEAYSPASSVESLNYRSKDTDSIDAPSTGSSDQVQPLSSSATAVEVTKWLHRHRFSSYVNVFQNFAGSDLLRLTRDDLIQICGLVDGIRLNNALQSKNVRPKLTIYVSQCDEGSKKAQKQPPSPPPPPPLPPPPPTASTSTNSTPHKTAIRRSTSTDKLKSPSPTPPSTQQGLTMSGTPVRREPLAAGRRGSNSNIGSSTAVQASKRQFREDEEEEELHQSLTVSSSKKQRTRTLRMSQAGIYHAIYLDTYTVQAVKEKMAALFMIEPYQITETFIAGPSGINILVTDDVVQNLVDQSRFHVDAVQDEDVTTRYTLHMKTLE